MGDGMWTYRKLINPSEVLQCAEILKWHELIKITFVMELSVCVFCVYIEQLDGKDLNTVVI